MEILLNLNVDIIKHNYGIIKRWDISFGKIATDKKKVNQQLGL